MARKGGATVPRHQAWSAEAGAAALQSLPAPERLILPALQRIQATFGWVPDESVDVIAQELNVSRAEVVGVLTYYHDLRQAPPPEVHVQVCVAEACQAVGSRRLATDLEASYGVPLGERADGVEFAAVYCLGNCALGPAVMVEGRLIGRCDIERIRDAIALVQEVRA
jgi:formate dehydrogenase subunit gamma